MPRPTPEISASPTLSLTSPPAAVAFQHNTDHLTPFDAPNLPSSAYTVLDNILLTGPPLSSRLSIARSGLSSSYPESHHSMIVTSAPSASPESTSVPDLGAAVVDDGIAKPGLRKEQDTFDPPFVHVNPSVNRSIYTNPMPTLDLPPQPPSLPSVTDSDITIAGPSIWESNVERIGDRPPHLSHGQYNIV
ncbi:hypothetical protein EDB83DRAFT_2392918 [Lactarius deliciosus]|nr:hypothetical protein EDB83DRAFT_2392918 [Lactarius deliciosus]